MRQLLQLTLLGGIEITLDGEPVTGFVSGKAQALLCYLAVSGRSHTREALAGLFWSSVPDADARTSLRQALLNLRKLAGAHLTITRQTAAFNQESPHWLDVAAFQNLRQSGGTGDAAAIDLLEQAVALYHGDFLAGFYVDDCPPFEEWALQQQEQLRQSVLQALQQVATFHMQCGDYRRAIRYTRRWLALSPWQEAAHRQMMRLLAYDRQYNEALLQYEKCRTILERELGVRPMPETAGLQQRIQTMRSTWQRLQLPVPPSPLIGREQELAELTALLHRPDCRLVTILGLGGVGKTRLALEAASRLTPVFLEGVVFVSLANVSPLHPSPHHTVAAVAAAIAEALTDYGAARLFQSVAARHRRQANLNGDSTAVIQICHLTAGLPLALELAAATTNDIPPAEIAAGIHRSLDFLHSQLYDMPVRHRSLRAVFDHSWQRLNHAECDSLRRLSVFRGRFPAAAAQKIAGGQPALLQRLAEKSLLQSVEENDYTMHDMIRRFAAEKLATEPKAERLVRERHADYYANLLEVENERLLASPGALDRIERDLPNIRAAWQWATQQSQTLPLRKMSSALTQFFFMRGRSPEGATLLQDTVARLEETAAARPLLGRLLAQQAWLQRGTHPYDETESSAERSLALCRAADDPYGEAAALETISWLVYYQGRYDEAIRLGRQALDLRQAAGEPYNLAYMLRMLGLYHLNKARYPAAGESEPPAVKTVAALRHKAYDYFQEALALAQSAANRWSEARILSALGYHAFHTGQYEKAAGYHRTALAVFRELDLPERAATSLCWLGPSLSQLGQREQARQCIYEALSIALTLGIPMSMIGALDQLVDSVLVKAEDTALAVELSALILSQPTTDERLRYRHEKLLAENKAVLPKAEAAAAEQRGRHGRLEDVVLQLLVDDDR